MAVVHLKIKEVSSFRPVTRKTPLVCRGNLNGSYIQWFKGEPETVEQVRERLARIDPEARLCRNCAAGIADIKL